MERFIGQLTQPSFFFMAFLYPCCGRLTATLRGPNIIEQLTQLYANAGGCWPVVCALRCAGRKRGDMWVRGVQPQGLQGGYAVYPQVTLRSPAVKVIYQEATSCGLHQYRRMDWCRDVEAHKIKEYWERRCFCGRVGCGLKV